jgi:NarL family two-component system response regulator LiaR
VLVVDDDPLARRALRDALVSQRGFVIEAEADSGDEAIDLAVRRRPELILMDVDIPVVDGVIATLRIRRQAPDVQVVLLSTGDDEELGLLGLRAGAAGFLSKGLSTDALARSLRGVSRGEAAISRTLARKLIELVRDAPERASGMRPVQSTLTSREWQVLDLMCAGASTERIADELVLSIETVRSHVKHILSKLGAHSRAEAVDAAGRLRSAGVAVGAADVTAVDEMAFRRVLTRLRERRRR